jgi:glycosyltransferase involved in cell wall biosynthesis
MTSASTSELSPAVSVLMPLYNHERTVEEALDSVLLSDCAAVELIVSDDASPDGSFRRAEAWIERHRHRFQSAVAIRQERNLGINGNLNCLTGMARGEYITLLASDDRLTEGSVDAQRRYLVDHPGVDFVFANVGRIDPDGNVLPDAFVDGRRARALRHPTCAVVDLVFHWGFPWPRLFARREAFMKLGPYIADHSYEDRWSALKIAETRRFGYLDRVVHLYRERRAATGTAGLQPERLVRDMHDIERRMLAETTGLLHALLWIRCRSFRRDGGETLGRIFWVAVRRTLAQLHRVAIS